MAIKHLIRPELPPPTPAGERPPGVTCEQYTRGEGKRCLHFQPGGACALPDELVCREWVKVNGPQQRTLPVVELAAVAPPTVVPPTRDLFGDPRLVVAAPVSPSPPPVATAPVATPSGQSEPAVDVDQRRGLTTEDIDSFKALGVEVLLHSETNGDVWLVPAYTGRDRKEITPEHAATLARVLSVFPGSQVVSFEKPTSNTTTHPERPERPVEERS